MVGRIDLKVGFSCNNRCSFCVQGDKRDRYEDKSVAALRSTLDAARSEGARSVVFTGGEPTMHGGLPALVSHARQLGFEVIQIQTNGRRLSYSKYAAALVAAGATEFSPAVHGPTAEIHDALTRAGGSFEQTVRGIRNVQQLGCPVIVNSVITRANYRHLPQTAALFVELGVRCFQLAFVHALGAAGDNFEAVVPRLSDVEPYVIEALDVGRRAKVRCMTEAIPLCFLRDYERHAAEWIIPRTKVYDADWTIDDYTEYRLNTGKAKGPPCEGCASSASCEGPWREYPEHFGWGEFTGVSAAS